MCHDRMQISNIAELEYAMNRVMALRKGLTIGFIVRQETGSVGDEEKML